MLASSQRSAEARGEPDANVDLHRHGRTGTDQQMCSRQRATEF